MSVEQPSSLRLVATLGVAGLLSGLILVGIYLATLPRIRQNQADALERAIFAVLPKAESFDALQVKGDRLVPYEGPVAKAEVGEVVYAAKSAGGALVGYAVPAEGPGFQDTITLLYGLDATTKSIVGLEILESRETPGLGDKIVADPAFHANFQKLRVEPEIVPVTGGGATEPNEVDCIAGATISSKSVVAILNHSVQRWLPLLTDPSAVAMGGHP